MVAKTRFSVVGNQSVTALKKSLAKNYRQSPTAKEAEVWSWLRNRQMLGLKWRRQQVIVGFIADFYCAEHRLALELDGDIHLSNEAQKYDAQRDEAFRRHGIRTCRISNSACTRVRLELELKKILNRD